jgi:uncharacterized damage-inducible protein DinB
MENEIIKEFIKESINHAEGSFKRLFHCIEQLDDKQIWWIPNDKMNSVGVLIKHICGNMRQWTITSINNTEDKRNRPEEFLNDNKLTKAELISLADTTRSDFREAVKKLDSKRLTEQKRIQGYEVSLMGAVIHVLTHMEGHVGQIILLTRTQLGEKYKIFWVPKTAEQKAERKSS